MITFFSAAAVFMTFERIVKVAGIVTFFRKPRPCYVKEPRLVSIVQPILGGDPTLERCLEDNVCALKNEPVELLWYVDTDDDVGRLVCERILARHQTANVQLVLVPPPPDGVSPKMLKVILGFKAAKGDVLVVLDDDTVLQPQGLSACLPVLQKPGVGLVFGLPFYKNHANLWSSLVSCFVNSQVLMTYVPYTYLARPFTINGMFFALTRETYERIGGFDDLLHLVCDDFAVAQKITHAGLQIVQTPMLHGISTHVKDARHYFNLLNRWFLFPQISLMRKLSPWKLAMFYVVVFLPIVYPLYVLSSAIATGNPMQWLWFGACMFINLTLYMLLNTRYLFSVTPASSLPLALAMQVLLPLQVIASFFAPRRINWRGHIMAVDKQGSFHFVRRRGQTSLALTPIEPAAEYPQVSEKQNQDTRPKQQT